MAQDARFDMNDLGRRNEVVYVRVDIAFVDTVALGSRFYDLFVRSEKIGHVINDRGLWAPPREGSNNANMA